MAHCVSLDGRSGAVWQVWVWCALLKALLRIGLWHIGSWPWLLIWELFWLNVLGRSESVRNTGWLLGKRVFWRRVWLISDYLTVRLVLRILDPIDQLSGISNFFYCIDWVIHFSRLLKLNRKRMHDRICPSWTHQIHFLVVCWYLGVRCFYWFFEMAIVHFAFLKPGVS